MIGVKQRGANGKAKMGSCARNLRAERATDILLFPGCRPLLRLEDGFRALQMHALGAVDVADMAAELLKPEEALVREGLS